MRARYVMEFNMALVLVLAGVVSAVAGRRLWITAAASVLVVCAGSGFIVHAWRLQPVSADLSKLPSHQIADWLARNAEGARVYIAGELNGAINAWNNTQQVLGGHQGVSNLVVEAVHKEVSQGCGSASESSELARLWLQALNAPYIVVHSSTSPERFHWFVDPARFSSLPLVWSSAAGDAVRRLRGDQFSDAIVVDSGALANLPVLRRTNDLVFLRAYVSWAAGKRPAAIRWKRGDSAEIETALSDGEALLLKVSYDNGWRAPGARSRRDPIGFLLLEMAPGHHRVNLRYQGSWDLWLGRSITLATIVMLAVHAPLLFTAMIVVVPAIVAYLCLSTAGAPGARVAAETFHRIRPPLIRPGGIVVVKAGVAEVSQSRALSIYGTGFGDQNDVVRAWVGNREAPILYRNSLQVNVKLPANTREPADVSVEVNGCKGNSFRVAFE
jgi:hypothetical protein